MKGTMVMTGGRTVWITAFVSVAMILSASAREWRAFGVCCRNAHNYYVYTVNAESWKTDAKSLVSFGEDDLTPWRAQVVGDVLYVMCSDSWKETVEGVETTKGKGKVIRFKLDGTRIDEDAFFTFEGKGDGMTVTPDGKYMFISFFTDDKRGWIYRYTLSERKLETNFAKMNAPREMCCDGNGYLYVADRGYAKVYKFVVDVQADPEDADGAITSYVKSSKESLELGAAICYSKTEDCLYHGGKYAIRKLRASDLVETARSETLAEAHWFCTSEVIGGVPYFAAQQRNEVYSVDPETMKLTDVGGESPIDLCAFPRTPYFSVVIR